MPHGRGSDISDSSPKIKLEPEEIHPLEYYVGDRVELIRQAFKCLKTKTIKSLAPDCLKVHLFLFPPVNWNIQHYFV